MRGTRIALLCLFILGAVVTGCSSKDTYSTGKELSYVQDKLELGMTKSEVKANFGRTYTNVHNSTLEHEVWRFDLAAEKEYIALSEPDGAQIDQSGLLTGKLSSQLFIEWNIHNVVIGFSLYYVEDGTILEYRSSK